MISVKQEQQNVGTRTIQRLKQAIQTIVDLYATPLKASHYIELVNPLWASHHLQAMVVDVWDETPNSRTVTLKPGRNWRSHRAGQHMRVGVPISGAHYTRTYSISSPPSRGDGLITITVKALEGGRLSPHIVRKLRKGAFLPIGLPQGEFVLPWARPVLPLFITAGSGITPVMSMLRNYVEESVLPDTVHMHYAPHEYDVIFGKELKAIDTEHPLYRYQPIYTRSLGDDQSIAQHFSLEQLEEICPDWRERECWACGPQSLLDSLEQHYEEEGLANKLNTERFRAALVSLSDDAAGGKVSFTDEAESSSPPVTVEADPNTPLLRVAEDAGLNPPHGCRMGICRTCDVPLVEGRVRDLRTGVIIEVMPQDTPRYISTCICAAAGDCSINITNT